MRSPGRKLPMCVLAMLALTLSAVSPQEKRAVRHPNLLLNREEIEEIRQKIQRYEWAAALFRRVQALADEPNVYPERNLRETALAYAITGQRAYGEKVRQLLVHQARAMLPEYEKLQLRLQPEFGAWGPWGIYAWAYDLCYAGSVIRNGNWSSGGCAQPPVPSSRAKNSGRPRLTSSSTSTAALAWLDIAWGTRS